VDVGRERAVAIRHGEYSVQGDARAGLGAGKREVGAAAVWAGQGAAGGRRRGVAPDGKRGRRRFFCVHVGRRTLRGGSRRSDRVRTRIKFALAEAEQGAKVVRGRRLERGASPGAKCGSLGA